MSQLLTAILFGNVGHSVAVPKRLSPSMPRHRFPPPWTVEETDVCFIVKDHGGLSLAYVYFEEEAGRRAAAKLLTRDEARRIAANIAKLPELVTKAPGPTGIVNPRPPDGAKVRRLP